MSAKRLARAGGLTTVLALLATGFLLISGSPAGALTVDTLSPGQSLNSGASLVAGAYRLIMQRDGNLVEYHGSDVLWASHTDHHTGSTVTMQRNGNVVLYGPDGHALWATSTNGDDGAHLSLQSDGNTVVYQGSTAVWAQTWRQHSVGAHTYAQHRLAQFGWSDSEMAPLVQLWNHESEWEWNATNPHSGAYGIPQSLPGDKMASAGPDWHDNGLTQITWGLRYIKDTYGSPSQAWAFWQQHNYY